MLPYWLLFLIPACLSASRLRVPGQTDSRWSAAWLAMFVLLTLAIGLRHEVGGDWTPYLDNYEILGGRTALDSVLIGDPAYGLLIWLAHQFELGPYFVNLICGAVFSWGLVVFCRAQPRPWLALVIAMPYLVTVVAMGYTRQGVAIGLAMLALVALSKQNLVGFVVFVAVAATFHKSAVILMPFAILASSRRRLWTALWVGLCSVLFYFLLLQDSVELLNQNYLEQQYESSGAAIRVAMNAVPAVLFLAFRRRFVMSPADRKFWSWMSVAALAFIGLLVVSPSSTAVDRMALYWIPLQLFVLSRLPNAMGPAHARNDASVVLVVAYSGAVLFVWLNFAVHSYLWLPYQFYPWVLLWR